MPAISAVGTGTTIVLGGVTLTVDRMSIGASGMSRESIETTHLGTSEARTFIPGDLYDPGTIEVAFQLDSTTPLTTMRVETIMNAASNTWTVTMSNNGQWDGNGFVTDFSWDIPLEELATGTFTLKCTGGIDTTN